MSIRKALYEAEKQKKADKKKMLPELHKLDDTIETFIQKLENKINAVKDNPVFIRKAHQMLGDMSKEYSEFIMALRAVVNAVDRKGQVLPQQKPMGKVNDINSKKDMEMPPEEAPPEEEQEVKDDEVRTKKKGIKEALLYESKYTMYWKKRKDRAFRKVISANKLDDRDIMKYQAQLSKDNQLPIGNINIIVVDNSTNKVVKHEFNLGGKKHPDYPKQIQKVTHQIKKAGFSI